MVGENIPGPNVNLSLSVIKREAKPIDQVVNKFERDGWKVTDTLGGGRVVYLEQSGINITAVSGPLGTVIIPSGPVRGLLFGDEVRIISGISGVGMGSQAREGKKPAEQKNPRRSTGGVEVLD